MTKPRNNAVIKIAKRRRQFALDRPELRIGTEPRVAAAGSTSFPLKAQDAETRRLIDEALAKRAQT